MRYFYRLILISVILISILNVDHYTTDDKIQLIPSKTPVNDLDSKNVIEKPNNKLEFSHLESDHTSLNSHAPDLNGENSISPIFSPQKNQLSNLKPQKLDENKIIISGNDNFTETAILHKWVGNGSIVNPIEIKDIQIPFIAIENTDLFFILNNITISSNPNSMIAYSQIRGRNYTYLLNVVLLNVSNGIIEESNTSHGMYLNNTQNIIVRSNFGFEYTYIYGDNIQNCSFINNYNIGFEIYNSFSQTSDITIEGNTIINSDIFYISSKNLNISDNFVNITIFEYWTDWNSGMVITSNSGTLENNIITIYEIIIGESFWEEAIHILGRGNVISNNNISFIYVNNLVPCYILTSEENNVFENNYIEYIQANDYSKGDEHTYWDFYGIMTGPNSVITSNVIKNIPGIAINLDRGNGSTVTNNSILNAKVGIKSVYGLSNSTFAFNTINNVSYGIKIASWLENNNISLLNLFDVERNNLSYNVINSNETGILIEDVDGQTVISNNNWAVDYRSRIDPNVENNVIQSNKITVTNDNYDIKLLGNSRFNMIYNNSFFRSYSSSEMSLAYDEGTANTFALNYWDSGNHLDEDKDRIVDVPYNISGIPNNYDATPLIRPGVSLNHILAGLRVIYPNGKDNIVNLANIIWSPVIDTEFHNIIYSIWLMDTNNYFVLIAENISKNEFTWDLNSIPNELKNDFSNMSFIPSGTNYYIKIVAQCEEGKTIYDTSDEPFRIIITSISPSPSNKPSSVHFELFPVLIIILSITVRRKLKKEN